MAPTFTWDPEKARQNVAKHGIGFEEATTVFGDPLSLTIPDPLHSDEEDRFITMGNASSGRLLVVVHTEQGNIIRIISTRRATAQERSTYEQGDI